MEKQARGEGPGRGRNADFHPEVPGESHSLSLQKKGVDRAACPLSGLEAGAVRCLRQLVELDDKDENQRRPGEPRSVGWLPALP